MAASDFFARWSRSPATPVAAARRENAQSVPHDLAGDIRVGRDDSGVSLPVGDDLPSVPRRVLTASDALALDASADFTPFMAHGVEVSVKRLALKRLFAAPHFNIMDGLDTYIEDFNTFVPMDPVMVASLNHAKALLDPLSQLLKPVMTLVPRELPNAASAQGQLAALNEAPGAVVSDGAMDGAKQQAEGHTGQPSSDQMFASHTGGAGSSVNEDGHPQGGQQVQAKEQP